MKRFESLDEFVEKTKEAQIKKLKNINCFLMPAEVSRLVKEERLFYCETDNVLQIVVKHDRYYKSFWYANEYFEFVKMDVSLPIITDIPFSKIMSDKMKYFEEKILSSGFKLNCSSHRMALKAEDEVPNDCGEYKIDLFKEEDLENVYNLWENSFDVVKNLLYSKNEILSCENPIYVCKDKEGNFVSAMELIFSGNYGWVQRIAVDKKYRGEGIGSIMEKFYINKCKSLGITNLLLYTIDGDYVAQSFHKKFGFLPDGKCNCQYVYRS